MSVYPFEDWFCKLAKVTSVHPWQLTLGADTVAQNRLIRIPTGFGKTAGAVLAWLYNRMVRTDDRWPRRLVYCLPMRVLVEQTEAEIRQWLEQAGLLWDGRPETRQGKVGVHVLMGGGDSGDWHLYPEENAILIGTQDMLLSRALNRGYAAPRARWPMEFGLLNHDALWVMDEVQLMDVGLTTSVQLQTFRHGLVETGLRPCLTWWMSATVRRDWLETVDAKALVDALSESVIPQAQQQGPLWEVKKPTEVIDEADIGKWAMRIRKEHALRGGVTLAVVNTVNAAVELLQALNKAYAKDDNAPEMELIHSRFRPEERKAWRGRFLRRDAALPPAGRLIVSTQVVEAGVDISAQTLFTELAPWASLVQRFGRSARYGGEARVFVLNRGLAEGDEKKALPYVLAELDTALGSLRKVTDVGPRHLEAVANESPELLKMEEPMHVLLRRELYELFDTTPDLTGADLDISRFIRSGDERDVQVAWLSMEKEQTPPETQRPPREALCPVPFMAAQDWLFGKGSKTSSPQKLLKHAWVWDYLEDAWRRPSRRDIYPGQVIVVAADAGGYDAKIGFDTGSGPIPESLLVPWRYEAADMRADRSQDREDSSKQEFQTIATHGRDVSQAATGLARSVGLDESLVKPLNLVGRLHDWGKAHAAFQDSIRHEQRPAGSDLAKAPKAAWPKPLYRLKNGDVRPGFRHELASVMALFDVLVRFQPEHPALLGTHRELMEELQWNVPLPSGGTPSAVEREILALSAEAFDLVAYLVCAHHGKVRVALHAAPKDQDYNDQDGKGMPIRGVRSGDCLPVLLIAGEDAEDSFVEQVNISLELAAIGLSRHTGASWTERVQGLLFRHGPFALAWLETLVRAADIRVSRERGGVFVEESEANHL